MVAEADDRKYDEKSSYDWWIICIYHFFLTDIETTNIHILHITLRLLIVRHNLLSAAFLLDAGLLDSASTRLAIRGGFLVEVGSAVSFSLAVFLVEVLEPPAPLRPAAAGAGVTES